MGMYQFGLEAEAFKEVKDEFREFKEDYLTETKKHLKHIRKTLVQPLADELIAKVYSDLDENMYSVFLDFSIKMWKESLNYILDENYKTSEPFKNWISENYSDAKELRKIIYEENKEDIIKALTNEYFFSLIRGHFDSGYWRSATLSLDDKYIEKKLLNELLKEMIDKVLIDPDFKDTFAGEIDDRINEKLEELKELEEKVARTQRNLSEIMAEM